MVCMKQYKNCFIIVILVLIGLTLISQTLESKKKQGNPYKTKEKLEAEEEFEEQDENFSGEKLNSAAESGEADIETSKGEGESLIGTHPNHSVELELDAMQRNMGFLTMLSNYEIIMIVFLKFHSKSSLIYLSIVEYILISLFLILMYQLIYPYLDYHSLFIYYKLLKLAD